MPQNFSRIFKFFAARPKSNGIHSYLWGTGQDDNIGDSILRRGYRRSLSELGPVTTWVGNASSSYVSGLGSTDSTCEFLSSFRHWYGCALRSSLKRKTVIAVNAGELSVSGKGAVRMISLLPLLLVSRLRGGGGLWLGASIPNHRPEVRFAYAWVAGLCKEVRWRESESQTTGRRTGLMPDWGFGLGSSHHDLSIGPPRRKMGIVLRGDRTPPDDAWLNWLANTCKGLGIEPHIVVQVERDSELGHALATSLSAQITPWLGEGHAQQEAAVREVYRQCEIVVGDRLHGLIVAATEGAIPLAWTQGAGPKARKHFEVVEMEWVGQYSGVIATDYPELDTETVSKLRSRLMKTLEASRTELEGVEKSLKEIFMLTGPSTARNWQS